MKEFRQVMFDEGIKLPGEKVGLEISQSMDKSFKMIGLSGEPTNNNQVLNPPPGGSAGHVDRRGV